MNDDYQRLSREADKLFHYFNDVVDNHPAAARIASDAQNVREDFEQIKGPRSVEDRIKRVIEELKQLKHGNDGSTMDFGAIDDLIDKYEELREEVRDLDNY
jgi:hypothetical protein